MSALPFTRGSSLLIAWFDVVESCPPKVSCNKWSRLYESVLSNKDDGFELCSPLTSLPRDELSSVHQVGRLFICVDATGTKCGNLNASHLFSGARIGTMARLAPKGMLLATLLIASVCSAAGVRSFNPHSASLRSYRLRCVIMQT